MVIKFDGDSPFVAVVDFKLNAAADFRRDDHFGTFAKQVRTHSDFLVIADLVVPKIAKT